MPRDLGPLLWLALLLLAVAVAEGAAAYLDRILSTSVAERFLLALRTRVTHHLLRLSPDFFEQRRLGDLLSRLSKDTNSVEAFMLSGMTAALADFLRVLLFAGAVFYLEWRLALVALFALPLFGLTVRRFSARIREASRKAHRHAGMVTAVAEEAFSNAALVQAFGREETEVGRFRSEGLGGLKAQLTSARLRGLYAFLVDLIELAGGLAVIALGTWALAAEHLTLGGLLVFVTYLGKLYSPIRGLGSLVNSAYAAAAGAERIVELLEQRPGVENRPAARRLVHPQGVLSFENVSFRYQGAKQDALSQVSFRVEPGQMLALVGPSGCGKSTIIKLLLRFYDPCAGRILIDGQDIRELSLDSLRAALALVLQETLLLHGSVRENIAYGHSKATEDDIARAACAADAQHFISSLPQGFDTLVGQKGRSLSGGQRQRLALARALVREAPILLLDEPTTGLDAATAARVLAPLERAASGRTRILVSHDLTAVRNASEILVLDAGRVIERGTHSALAAQGGRYASMLLDRAPQVVPLKAGAA